jgi:hypothetical protein|tara:strand:+ start:4417 stop:4719 length:303 start_codon:yes stop_codon:yes gene_type:complete
MASKLNEGSEFTIPLKNLIALIAVTGIAVWGYFGIEERLSMLEHDTQMMVVEIEENDSWIDNFKPPEAVQETVKSVRELEKKMEIMRTELEYLKASVYTQ